MHPSNIDSLGKIVCHDAQWKIHLPLFNRSTVALFAKLFMNRILLPYMSKGMSFVFERNLITTEQYLPNDSGILVPTPTTVIMFIKNGEHSEIIQWRDEEFRETVIGENNVEELFNCSLLDLYEMI